MPPVEIAKTLSLPPRPLAICGPDARPRPPPNPPPPAAAGAPAAGGAPARPAPSPAAPLAAPAAGAPGPAPPGAVPRLPPPRPAGGDSGVDFVRTGTPDEHAAALGTGVASFCCQNIRLRS